MKGLKTFLTAVMNFAAGVVPAEKRFHVDFLYSGEGWFYNKYMKQAMGLMPGRDSRKIKIMLNDADLDQLNDCPFIAKIGCNDDTNFPQKYCAFLYPLPGRDTIDDLAAWVEARAFPEAVVLTYGEDRPEGWVPGEHVRELHPAARHLTLT